jgi:hypothetical protein
MKGPFWIMKGGLQVMRGGLQVMRGMYDAFSVLTPARLRIRSPAPAD